MASIFFINELNAQYLIDGSKLIYWCPEQTDNATDLWYLFTLGIKEIINKTESVYACGS